MKKYDIICIGTGGAGNTASAKLAKEGKKVLICDYAPFGGTCAISGCDPKKIMITAAEFSDFARRLLKNNVIGEKPVLSWADMMAHKRRFTEGHPAHLTHKYDKLGIDYVYGRAEFTGEHTLKIGAEEYEFGKCLIGTGSRPFPLPFEGAEYVADNSVFLDMDELPDSLLFIGGGYISVEFANIASAFGAHCTIVQADDRLVPAFDKDIADVMTESLKSKGMEIICGAKVKKIEKTPEGYNVCLATAEGERTICAGLPVHGAGRVANLEGLNPEKGNVSVSRRGVEVNKYMQSVSNPDVFAAGDCADTGGYMLSPVAFMEGYAAAVNMMGENVMTPDHADNATVMFNVPAVAAIGLTETQAKEAGIDYSVKFKRTESWFTSFRVMEEFSAYKVLTDKKTGLIVGAHLIGPHAEDVINIFAVAMKQRVKAADLKKIVYAYPTASSDIIHML
ncbi:MAG: NAD(P)/FAD-dependent oxidoreductase [Deferribacterales bacterium]